MFSILGPRVVEATVLDIFAGSGSVGIEALSRGAKCGIFVETNRACVRLIRENLEKTRLSDRATVIQRAAPKALDAVVALNDPCDIVFSDPPYGKALNESVLEWINGHVPLLKEDGLIIIQQDVRETIQKSVGHLSLLRSHKVGSTCLCFYHIV